MSGSRMKNRKKTIFVLEDDPDIGELLEFNLVNTGYSVLLEKSGLKGFDLIKTKPPDLLLLDLNLPELSGFEICKYLRKNDPTSKLPIIVISARASEIDKAACLELGADDYITKPFRIKEMLKKIRMHLEQTQVDQSMMN
jgi:DNA-binding response OmpR family regulator